MAVLQWHATACSQDDGAFSGCVFFLQSILPSQVFFISITALILSTLHEKEYQLAAASLELEEKAAPRGAPFGGGVLAVTG